jgi:hypothetical protein
MFLESLLVLGVIAVILVFFYRQAIKEFRILQTDSLDKALGLLHERSPIVLLPAPTPIDLWTRKELKQRPALNQRIQPLLIQETSWIPPKDSRELAQEVGLPVWVNETLLPTIQQSQWWGPLLWAETKVSIGAQGLRPTFGYLTMVFPTEGDLQVSLINESADPYLPKLWLAKRLSKLTKDDAPLLPHIQFVDVIVRPGSALLIPPHWKVCWEPKDASKEPPLAVWIDFHHPVSALAQRRFYA